MIICGFPGVGKSTLAKFSNWVDLESTPFEKDWVRYAKVAKHMSNNGYNVMVSTHPQLLEQFEADVLTDYDNTDPKLKRQKFKSVMRVMRDFKTNKRLAKNIKIVEKYFDCEVKDYDYYDILENETATTEYYLLKIFI